MKKNIALLMFLLLIVIYFNFSEPPCNPKGSVAAQINWANHGECK